MKYKNKNFIAFTLSEMMIVLLIVSVISAATLPAITGKKIQSPQHINSKWQKDSTYDLGHYFIGSTGNTYAEVIVGQDTSNLSASDITTMRTNVGTAALKLQRPDASETLFGNGMQYANYGNSDIVFYNQENRYSGKIKADERGVIAIGEYAGTQRGSKYNNYGSLYIGHYAGASALTTLSTSYNTIVGSGVYTGFQNSDVNNRLGGSNNISIGNDITSTYLWDHNIIVGNYAATKASLGYTIALGNYSSYARNGIYMVNVGYYSGGSIEFTSSLPAIGGSGFWVLGSANSQINLGSYSGYYSGVTCGSVNATGQSVPFCGYIVNIGTYAGAFTNGITGGAAVNKDDSINIGSYSGYGSVNAPLNIGHYAGSNVTGSVIAVNIGEYTGANAIRVSSKYNQNINIGRYAGYGFKSSALTRAINIGTYSGYLSKNSENVINVGSYAGYDNNYDSANSVNNNYNINIGTYAGSKQSNITHEKGSSIHIGDKGTYGTNYSNVIIGCDGHNISAPYRMCIGGKYPSNSTQMTNVFKPTNSSETTYSSLFLPPGISATSASGWPYTVIWLMAKYVLSYSNTFSTFSDRRLKENIKATTDGIDKVRKLNIVQYNIINDKSPKVGVIAQELESIYPNRVYKATFLDGKQYYTVKYDRFVYSLTQAVKDLDKIAVNLQKEVKDNFKSLTKISNNVLSIENKLNNLANSNKNLQTKLKEIDNLISKAERK